MSYSKLKAKHVHVWVFTVMRDRNHLTLRCTECNGKKDVSIDPINLVQYALVPYRTQASLTPRERRTIEIFFLPFQQTMLRLAIEEIEEKIRNNEAGKDKLEKLKSLCNVLATM